MLTHHERCSVAFTWEQFHKKCPWSWSITFVSRLHFRITTTSPRGQWVNSSGQVTHIYIGKLTIIGSDNGLSSGRRQAIIWTNAGILLFGHLGTKFSEILNKFHTFSFKKRHLKRSSVKRRPFCFGLNVLISWRCDYGSHQYNGCTLPSLYMPLFSQLLKQATLTLWGLVTPYGVGDLGQHWFR